MVLLKYFCFNNILVLFMVYIQYSTGDIGIDSIFFTPEQYTQVTDGGLRIRVSKLPEGAAGLRFWTRREDMTVVKSKIHEIGPGAHNFYIKPLMLDEGENIMFATLWTHESVCGTIPLFVMLKDPNQSTEGGTVVDAEWVEWCSTQACGVVLQWNNTCGEPDSTLPPEKLAPLHLGQEQYSQMISGGLLIKVLNIPFGTVELLAWTREYGVSAPRGNKYRGTSPYFNTSVYVPAPKSHDNVHVLFVTLLTQKTVCGTKMIAEMQRAEDTSLRSNSVDPRWAQSCALQTCVVVIDWKNTCNITIPDPMPAPIHLTRDQYTNILKKKLMVKVNNAPNNTVRLHIWTRGNDMTPLKDKYYKINSTWYDNYIPLLDIGQEDTSMYVTLLTQDEVCGTKKIVVMESDDEHKTLGHSDHVDPAWLHACSSQQCLLEVDWENSCFSGAKPTIAMNKPLEVGNNVTFTCRSNEEETSIQWLQVYPDGTVIVLSPLLPTSVYNLTLTLEAFDCDSRIQCTSKPLTPGFDKTASLELANYIDSSNCHANFDTLLVVSYDNSTDVDVDSYRCINNGSFIYIQENKIQIIENAENLTMNYNGSVFGCLYFESNGAEYEIVRYVTNKTMLMFTEYNGSQTNVHICNGSVYYIVGAFIVIYLFN